MRKMKSTLIKNDVHATDNTCPSISWVRVITNMIRMDSPKITAIVIATNLEVTIAAPSRVNPDSTTIIIEHKTRLEAVTDRTVPIK